jgi:plasmid stability protein
MKLTTKRNDPSSLMAQRADQALKEAGKPGVPGEVFLTSLSRSLISALLARAGIKGESLTYAEARAILVTGGFPEETVTSATRLLESIYSARFSGREMDSESRKALLAKTRELVRKIS